MDTQTTTTTTTPAKPSVLLPSTWTTLNKFLWNFFKTLTISSILFMILSIYFALFGSDGGGNNHGIVVCTITLAYAISTPTFINPNLPKISAMCIPFLELNKALSFRLVKIIVCTFFASKSPCLIVYLGCSCLMGGIGMLKLYGDGGYDSYRVIYVITSDAIEPLSHQFLEDGVSIHGWVFVGLNIIGLIAYYTPPLVEPVKKMKNMNETSSAAVATGVLSEKIMNETTGRVKNKCIQDSLLGRGSVVDNVDNVGVVG